LSECRKPSSIISARSFSIKSLAASSLFDATSLAFSSYDLQSATVCSSVYDSRMVYHDIHVGGKRRSSSIRPHNLVPNSSSAFPSLSRLQLTCRIDLFIQDSSEFFVYTAHLFSRDELFHVIKVQYSELYISTCLYSMIKSAGRAF
jgi:hypothetical protein